MAFTMKVAAVIVAGGTGTRAGGDKPKQYQMIGNKPAIWWTLQTFLSHPAISHVQVVMGQDHHLDFIEATAGLALPAPVIGGESRQESCRIGIESCAQMEPDHILIHDAARPFISHGVIDSVLAGLNFADAVIPGIAVADTLKFAPNGIISRTVDRGSLYSVQTPQGFHYPKILAAHRTVARDGKLGLTDDAAVAEYAGMKVHVVNGDPRNVKLTTQLDITIANEKLMQQKFLEKPDIRVGQGIDFHVFEKGKAVRLCGVDIPHNFKLKGHSDADVALHALTDAILGAIGEGDIGTHFSPSDAQWKNADSKIFVEKAITLLHAQGGIVANVDITILAEAPKINPHLAAMKMILAPLLGISATRIAIKATTTEKMGAIGRKEGMAALAVVTVRLPA
jgi:2-C-methyl-D-erythritol 4-phosphate cytidylyltransferase / 2-C-methyl-D-erythritol 2,4-cyclodiphosphate synthase